VYSTELKAAVILKVAKTYEVGLERRDEFGQRHTLDFMLH